MRSQHSRLAGAGLPASPHQPKPRSIRGALPIGSARYSEPAGALYVATSGNDANSGVVGSPLRTLARALSKAPSGGTVILRGGTYHESVDLDAAGDDSELSGRSRLARRLGRGSRLDRVGLPLGPHGLDEGVRQLHGVEHPEGPHGRPEPAGRRPRSGVRERRTTAAGRLGRRSDGRDVPCRRRGGQAHHRLRPDRQGGTRGGSGPGRHCSRAAPRPFRASACVATPPATRSSARCG